MRCDQNDRFAIRGIGRRDHEAVMEIERASFIHPWTDKIMRQTIRDAHGIVVECEGTVVGYAIYDLRATYLHVLNFAVHPAYRRRGIGRRLVERLMVKLNTVSRKRIRLEICETNLEGQMFWRSMGFKAVNVLRGWYSNKEDAYVMTYRVKPAVVDAAIRDMGQCSGK